jgi:RNA polymerase sigma-70 factor (ECF subfamily)
MPEQSMAVHKLLGISHRRELKRLVVKNRGRLYRMAYAWTHDPHLADDLVQQTVCKALGKHRQLRDLAAAEGWLFRILANCLTDHRRAKREVLSNEEFLAVEHRTPERLTQEEQLVQRVRRGVGKLPLPQRQVVTLVDLEGFTYAAVAQILDIPVGTVMSRLCRGRRALRDLLKDIRPSAGADKAPASITRIR